MIPALTANAAVARDVNHDQREVIHAALAPPFPLHPQLVGLLGAYLQFGVIGSFSLNACLSEDGSADLLPNKALADQVNNVASDWNIKPTADARNQAADVSGSWPEAGQDFLYRTRQAPFDIGPAELIVPNVASSSVLFSGFGFGFGF